MTFQSWGGLVGYDAALTRLRSWVQFAFLVFLMHFGTLILSVVLTVPLETTAGGVPLSMACVILQQRSC